MSEEENLSEIIQTSFGSKAPKAEAAAKGEQPAKAEAAPPAVEPEAKADVAEVKPDGSRDEKGRFAKAEEKAAEKPAEKPRADVAAIIDERRKRQELERRLEQLQAQQKPADRPSVFENEDQAISSRVDEGTRPLREMLYKMSVKSARALYRDTYADAEQAFMEAAEKDERLLTGLRASEDPGEYIHSMGLHVRELSDVGGDIMKYRDKVTASSKAQMDALQAQLDAMKVENEALKKAQTDLDNVPRSLNNTSSGASPKAGSEDDEDIKSIARFGNQKR